MLEPDSQIPLLAFLHCFLFSPSAVLIAKSPTILHGHPYPPWAVPSGARRLPPEVPTARSSDAGLTATGMRPSPPARLGELQHDWLQYTEFWIIQELYRYAWGQVRCATSRLIHRLLHVLHHNGAVYPSFLFLVEIITIHVAHDAPPMPLENARGYRYGSYCLVLPCLREGCFPFASWSSKRRG